VTSRSGRPSSSLEGMQLSVFPWIAGTRGYDTEMTNEHWRLFGSLLGRVHTTNLPATLESRLPHDEFGNPAVAAARSRLIEFRNNSPAFDEFSRSMVSAWLDAAESIAALIDRSEELTAALQDRSAPGAVCHGDAHTINLIIDPDNQPFLLDWDEVSIAPPERDLMFVIGGGIFTDDPVTAEHQQAFAAGYGPVEIDETRLAYYYCTRALEDITEFAKEILDGTAEPHSREFALRCVRGLLSPVGTVEAAIGFAG
jgi:Ser/Thr protein kinase RdoA (MazF antagonist)